MGAPSRRLFDRRVLWLLNALDERLGSPSDGRPVHERLDRIAATLERHTLLAGELTARSPLVTLQPDGRRVRALSDETAALLNWAEGPQGLAAEAGLWFNPPVPIEYREGRVEVMLVNERIVEQPFVFGALSQVPPPARVLDVGGAESTVALSMASLGYDVTVVDPRGYPVPHPRLAIEAKPLHELGPDHFDVIVALSAIEHFGLGYYGDPRAAARRLDLEAMSDIRRRLAPGGLLVLTVPVGPASVDELQRTYDPAGLQELLGGFTMQRAAFAEGVDRLTWSVREWGSWHGERGVAMLTASRTDEAP